ncbi:hypothetical protein NY99_08425 [Xanthomonas phaseoli pv. phaseoli]|nr:hypothetical protein NY99_08425 [Xanthomonas phaseoli pv. phaseoli]KHF48847.1 hypothetical protein QQ30_08795 [Xanthomonas phaseoli pv. phaseoli]KHS07898.1 hypothetical protein RM61_08070 [Xanthomonas phaseoli pv. phaseoli]KHS29485.1 hypothetical protein RM60_11505 [Xanthomonas phaseoli pv. phaseoli]
MLARMKPVALRLALMRGERGWRCDDYCRALEMQTDFFLNEGRATKELHQTTDQLSGAVRAT